MLGVIGDPFDSLDEFMWAMTRQSACPTHLGFDETIAALSSIDGTCALVDELVEKAEET